MSRASLSRRNIERTQRVQTFLEGNKKPSALNMEETRENTNQEGTAHALNEEDLDIFMDLVTDKKLVEEANDHWQKKT